MPSKGWRSARARAAAAACAARPGSVQPPDPAGADHLLAHRDLLLFLGVMSLNGFMLDGFTAIFPQAVRALDAPRWADAVLDAAILGLGGVGQWLGGLAARGGRQATRYAALVMLQPLLFAGAALALRGSPAAAPLALFAAFAFLDYGLQPMENRLLAAYTSSARRSAAYAVKFLLALVVGAGAPPLVVAAAERWGHPASFLVLCGFGLAGATLAASYRRASGIRMAA